MTSVSMAPSVPTATTGPRRSRRRQSTSHHHDGAAASKPSAEIDLSEASPNRPASRSMVEKRRTDECRHLRAIGGFGDGCSSVGGCGRWLHQRVIRSKTSSASDHQQLIAVERLVRSRHCPRASEGNEWLAPGGTAATRTTKRRLDETQRTEGHSRSKGIARSTTSSQRELSPNESPSTTPTNRVRSPVTPLGATQSNVHVSSSRSELIESTAWQSP